MYTEPARKATPTLLESRNLRSSGRSHAQSVTCGVDFAALTRDGALAPLSVNSASSAAKGANLCKSDIAVEYPKVYSHRVQSQSAPKPGISSEYAKSSQDFLALWKDAASLLDDLPAPPSSAAHHDDRYMSR